MTKFYAYEITGRDGEDEEFQVGGWVRCEYAEVWEAVNLDALQRLRLPGGAVCPITIESVSIVRKTLKLPEVPKD